MRVALVHDWLNTRVGGSEQVLIELANLYPEADIYSLFFRQPYYLGRINPRRVTTSYLQHWPQFLTNRPRYVLPLLAGAIEQFDFSGYDLVISSSNGYCKGVITPANTLHICYCYSPMRFAWDYWPRYLDEQDIGPLTKFWAAAAISKLRQWDYYSAQRVDRWVTISNHVAARIDKFYGAQSEVIYPPVQTDAFAPVTAKEDYCVTLATLTPYKKIEVAIAASNNLRQPLVVIGDGFDRPRLERLAGPQVRFAGRVDDRERARLLAGAQALLMPQEEDFGLVAVEALASGTPVVAYDRGGVSEIITTGQTGVLYTDDSATGLAAAITQALATNFDQAHLRRHSQRFNQRQFAAAFTTFVNQAYAEYNAK